MSQTKRPTLEILSWIVGILAGVGTLVAFLLPKSEKPPVTHAPVFNTTTNNSQKTEIISVIKDSPRPQSVGSSNTQKAPPESAQATEDESLQFREIKGFGLTINGCENRSGVIACRLLLEMKRQGSESISFYPSKVVATFPDGEAANATRVVLGTKESKRGRHVLYTLSPHTPTAMAIEIGDLANTYSEIRNLKIVLDHMEFNFRSIPVD